MTQPSRDQLNALADKWLKGTLTSQEKELLDKWYNLDTSEPIHWTGVDESEKHLGERLSHNIQTKRKSRSLIKRWQIPAAAILLITLSISGHFYFSKPVANYQIVNLSDINPGKNKAILTLGNGQKISLTDLANGKQIASQSGMRIIKTADGKLVYDASSADPNANIREEYNTIEAPTGGQWEIKLPDGSLVFLNASSSITYPTRFIGKERNVQMNGEAYFEIAHNKKMPFKVSSQGQTVEVLGTHFNVMAYGDEKLIKTTLLEGSIKISDHGQSKLLKPGEQAQVSANEIKVTDEVDLEDVVAWKNGYFKFNENLESIMAKVARWYNVEVEYKFRPDPNLTFSGKISRARKISGILAMLAYNGDVHFKIEGRRIIVMK